ncbi:MAG: outer-membrane lipoprotein carrier protein LolA [Prevotella sp.]|jgi:outer membrane lipoprotein-sorting protein|nr:outer-membrane lipoprotein carrier protein LolA [Prevotella sp.]MBP7097363.1 outer-membrane lipoprotein carrier protein LolA [Prevotella sp.]MBP8686413.1 outer-membrane lipoprotein carrier protein LolA [Prevotella sp.]MBP8936047.1 outer-membrane lipoprotein carrier protein LolA [Prevotella sp.]MBP9982009.1 outer-membrane lipoprotein carrier protein LolA [Prevotella sp.]
MKKFTLISLMMLLTLCVSAQGAAQAARILDKTAGVIGRKGGASANFSVSGKSLGATSGTIAIKGNKFYANTPKTTVWFNGKTQWTYMNTTNEVNVTNPNEAKQAQMNPYKFITIYKTGYNLSMKSVGNSYQIHMTAQNKQRSLQELYITINKRTYNPSNVRMLQGKNWTIINISNFKANNLSNDIFSFNSKDYPKAEIIDLR